MREPGGLLTPIKDSVKYMAVASDFGLWRFTTNKLYMIDKGIIKKIVFKIAPLKWIWEKLKGLTTVFILRFNPRFIANRCYRTVFKKNVNWDKPTNLIEKIMWLQLYSDTRLWTICADKFLVREFVKDRECGDVLNPLYGRWECVSAIDWSLLPEKFVLKANHSCGQVIVVKDKSALDIKSVTRQLNGWLKSRYGYSCAQLHYTRIKPCIIAEKLIENSNLVSQSLIDFKIWCFHGKPEGVLVAYNRSEDNYALSFYDLEWNNISRFVLNRSSRHYSGIEIPRPTSFNKMIQTAVKLSKGFPQVRVDFYEVGGNAIFGEMTFTTGFGSYSNDFYTYLGSKIDLKKVKKLKSPNKGQFLF